jgi:hypothetical protein
MIRRLTTPDLMFGQMVAPPPVGVASISESVSITDVLSCFTSEGLPTNANLSPIAMVTSHMIIIHKFLYIAKIVAIIYRIAGNLRGVQFSQISGYLRKLDP